MGLRGRSLVVVAALLLGSGVWGLAVSLPPPVPERRDPAPWPAAPATWAQAQDWPHAFDRAWGDRFPWRWAWVALDGGWRVRLLGAGRNSVTPGGGGMLFLDEWNTYAAVTGRWRLGPDDAQAWRRFARDKAALAHRHGAALIVALVPDKATVYPELRPAGWGAVGPGALEQVGALLAQQPGLLLLDLRPAMAQARQACPAYFKADSHWSPEGAAYAWQALVAAARSRWPGRDLPPLRDPQSWGWRVWEPPYPHDLAAMLGLWPDPPEQGVRLPATPPGFDGGNFKRLLVLGRPGGGPGWLFYHDSFAYKLSYFPRLQGWRCLFMHNAFGAQGPALDDAALAAFHPGVVVVELAERGLYQGPPR